jgi:hypothetical protein
MGHDDDGDKGLEQQRNGVFVELNCMSKNQALKMRLLVVVVLNGIITTHCLLIVIALMMPPMLRNEMLWTHFHIESSLTV